MINKGLLKLLAILAIFVGSTAIPVPKSCDKIEDCKTCLDRIDDCAWDAGKDIPGCVAQEKCTDKDTCFVGEADADGLTDGLTNEYKCGNTCNLKSGSTCNECMKTDLTGKRKADCAWFIRGNEDPQCIYRKRCDDKGFEGGKCILGKKNRGNNKKCARKQRDVCPRLKNCGKCLSGKKGQSCAWANDGKGNYSCVAEDKCQGDNCIYGSTTFNVRKRCKAEKTKAENKPKPDPNDPPVGIEKCEDFNGLCTDCLLNGCAWVNINQQCLESCDIIADVGCDVLPKPEKMNDAIGTFNRSLIRFENKASEKCYDLKREYKNNKLCSEAKEGGCDECVNTQLFPDPEEVYIHPPTCHWLPESKVCQPDKCNWWECGQDICEIVIDPPISIFPPPLIEPPPKLYTEFPELLNKTAKYAFEYLNTRYGQGTLNIIPVTIGDNVIENIENDRVWLWVEDANDKDSIIVEVPKVK